MVYYKDNNNNKEINSCNIPECISIFNIQRRPTSIVNIGAIQMGGDNPIRLQSMTTTNTNDTQACVEQTIKIVNAGGEIVRLTTQGKKEALNLKNINAELRKKNILTPLVADVHFNANVADVAALYAEKVRINPGNYVDPGRTFKILEYTDEQYADEIKKIEKRFIPFLNICKQNNTAIRIGVNHGSLSDRIMSRYGDTPEGIVESCMEFLRICQQQNFNNVVISIKASNTKIMVESVRLLVYTMQQENMKYPIHLGVTEAGEGEDGRIKSAVGIGALLSDGIGDTIRVSLSEEPEKEIPVAKYLVNYISKRYKHLHIPGQVSEKFNYLKPQRRNTFAIKNIGADNYPVVIASHIDNRGAEITTNTDTIPDYIYTASNIPTYNNTKQKYIVDFNVYQNIIIKDNKIPQNVFPIFPYNAIPFINMVEAQIKFLVLPYGADSDEYIPCLKNNKNIVVVSMSNHQNKVGEQRALVHELMINNINNPVVFAQMYRHNNKEKLQIEAAADMGALMIDGLTDGIWIMNYGDITQEDIEQTAFAILQAARLRMSKTEYISCPGCGRTLYNLRDTIAKIRKATMGMKGLKIGIMGCIVNGPGEMADADYGYVGAGVGKISLYKKKICVEKNIPEDKAVEKLLELIKFNENYKKNK